MCYLEVKYFRNITVKDTIFMTLYILQSYFTQFRSSDPQNENKKLKKVEQKILFLILQKEN